jgi:hypothetical protein
MNITTKDPIALSELSLRVCRCEENLHLARSNKSARIVARRERLLAEAIAKLTPEELASERARRANMNGF